MLRRGDAVASVDGRGVAGLDVDAVAKLLRGRPGSVVAVVVRRERALHAATIQRGLLTTPVVRSRLVERAGTRTGVIGLTQFSAGAGRRVRAAARRLVRLGARSLVLDLRRNPGGYVEQARTTASAFLTRGSVVVREHGAHIRATVLRTTAAPVRAGLPMAVLVDRDTASSAEIVTGALRDDARAIVVVERTFGKGVIQGTFVLRRGGALKVTIAECRTPRGAAIEHRGVAPDITSRDRHSVAGDPGLDAALGALRRH